MALNLARRAERVPRGALLAAAVVLLGAGVLAVATTEARRSPAADRQDDGGLATVDATTTAPATSATTGVSAQPPGSGPAAPEAQARIVISDPRGARQGGLPLIVEGPVTRQFVSGPDGVVAVTAPAGRYRVRVPQGCAGQLHVPREATGSLALAEGQVASGQLTVGVTFRYLPGPGTSYRPESGGGAQVGWRPGEVHVVDVGFRDRCRQPVPEGTVLDRWRFEVGDGVELAGPVTTRADASGRISVPLRCVRDDTDVTLALVERDPPNDRHEVLTRDNLAESGPPYCLA